MTGSICPDFCGTEQFGSSGVAIELETVQNVWVHIPPLLIAAKVLDSPLSQVTASLPKVSDLRPTSSDKEFVTIKFVHAIK